MPNHQQASHLRVLKPKPANHIRIFHSEFMGGAASILKWHNSKQTTKIKPNQKIQGWKEILQGIGVDTLVKEILVGQPDAWASEPAGGFGQIDYGNCLDEHSSTLCQPSPRIIFNNHLWDFLTDSTFCTVGDMWEGELRQSPTLDMVRLVGTADHRLNTVDRRRKKRHSEHACMVGLVGAD